MTVFVKLMFLMCVVDAVYWGYYVCKREVPPRDWSSVVWNFVMHVGIACCAGWLIFGGR